MVKQDKNQPHELQGWQEIADFRGLPVTTAHRWEKSGMPVHRDGRYVYALSDELNRWLGKESHAHAPLHIATENEDLSADLKRALSEAKRKRKPARKAALVFPHIPQDSHKFKVFYQLDTIYDLLRKD